MSLIYKSISLTSMKCLQTLKINVLFTVSLQLKIPLHRKIYK